MAILAANMNEIKLGNRLHDYNHSIHFKSIAACIVDTFPIVVYQHVDDVVRASLQSGKYKATVLKVEYFLLSQANWCAQLAHTWALYAWQQGV